MPACAIDEFTAGRYTASTVSVQHLFVTTGLITFRCNVENLPIAPDTTRLVLELVYRDADGPGTSYSVRAELFQLTDNGLPIVRAIVNSNNFPASPDLQTQHTTFSHDFDFLNNSYFVQVEIFRANPDQVPAAAIVRIRRLLIDEQ
jgi:hypothetical protein